MQAVNWIEVVASAKCLAPDVPPALWREVELAMRGWTVAQEAAGYVPCEEDVVHYARALASLVQQPAARASLPEPPTPS